MENLPRKIFIIGTSGCGKTTLALQLSKQLGIKSVELDDLYWLPNWECRSDEDFLNQITEIIYTDKWILCGNYSKFTQAIWHIADIVIWLDVPLLSCLWRSLKRSVKRCITKQSCCNGNYESLSRLFGKNSILLWIWKTHNKRRVSYNNQCKTPLIKLRSKAEIQKFIKANLKVSKRLKPFNT